MTLTANYAHDAITRAVAATPGLINAAVNRAIINDARSLLKMGPMEQRARFNSLLGLYQDCYFSDGLSEQQALQSAINAERKRGRSGHWAFDGNRLIALRGHLLARRYERRFEG